MSRFIIDVREPEEYVTGHAKNALNIPPSELMDGTDKLATIPKDAEVILYCKSGSRSNVTKNILESMGYTNVINGINKDHVSAKYGS
jgi:phage shock protein E